MKKVAVVGLWHLGLVNAAGLAAKGYRVVAIEFSPSTIKKLRAGQLPLVEPGLPELIMRHTKTGRLTFSARPAGIRQADYVIIAYDSPITAKDEVDITPIIRAVRTLAPHLSAATPVIITSQVPLGTSEKIERLIKKTNRHWRAGVAYTPENLKLGEAIKRFLQPDMLVLGTNTPAMIPALKTLYRPFRAPKIITTLRTAEMVKHALNGWLALSISYINEVAQLAPKLRFDAVTVGASLRRDSRIGRRALLHPGLGFAGGTLARDVRQLQKLAAKQGRAASLMAAVMAVNESTYDYATAILKAKLGSLRGKKIGLMGLTYKPGTSTMRRSPALKIMHQLHRAGARCFGYDPQADRKETARHRSLFRRVKSLPQLARAADTLLLVTEWPEFEKYPYRKLAPHMSQPLLIDLKNFLDPAAVRTAGFTYYGFGRE